jgi:hypothetical protein
VGECACGAVEVVVVVVVVSDVGVAKLRLVAPP